MPTGKNKRALYLLLGANAISGFSQGISMFGIAWYFTDMTNQDVFFLTAFGIITLLTLPWSLFAGTLVDRYPRKNVFLVLTGVGMLVTGSVALAGFISGEVPALLALLVFGTTIFNFNVHYPTLYAFGQEITEPENYGRTNSLIEIQGQSTSMIAGALATVLLASSANEDFIWSNIIPFKVEPWNLHEIFLLDCCTYAIAFLLILGIRYTPPENKQVDTGSVAERFRGGLRFLKKNPLLIHFGISTYMIFIVVIVSGFALMPIYVSDHLQRGGDIYGLGEIFYAMGAVTAGFFINRIFRQTNRVKAILILMAFTAIGLFVCSFTRITPYFIGFGLMLGLANSGTRILRITYLFNHVPNRVIGRTNSIFAFTNIFMRGSLLLLFAIPFFTRDGNIVWAYFICAAVVVLGMVPLILFYKRLRGLRIKE